NVKVVRPWLAAPPKHGTRRRQEIPGHLHGLGAVKVNVSEATGLGTKLHAYVLWFVAEILADGRRRDVEVLPPSAHRIFLPMWNRDRLPSSGDVAAGNG